MIQYPAEAAVVSFTPHDGTFYCRQHVGVLMERFLCFLWLMIQRFILFSFKMLVGSYFYIYIFLLDVPADLCMVLLCERKMLTPASKTSLKLDCGLFD